MGMQNLGGIPRAKTVSIDTTGRVVPFEALSMSILVRAAGNACRLYFTKDDFDANINFWEVRVADPPLQIPLEDRSIFMRGVVGASDVQLVVFHRKG